MSSEDEGSQGGRLAPSPVRPGKFRLQKALRTREPARSSGTRTFHAEPPLTHETRSIRPPAERENNPIDTLKELNHARRALRPSVSILSISVSGPSRRREITTDTIFRWRMARRTHPRGDTPLVKGIGGHLQTFEPWVAKGCICLAPRQNWAVARSTPHPAIVGAFAPESLASGERGARAVCCSRRDKISLRHLRAGN